LSRLSESGPRLVEVGPIRSSVSLKLAHQLAAQVERLQVDNQRLRTHVGELAAQGSVTELIPKSCRSVARDYRTWRVVRPKFAGKFAGALPGPGKAPLL
jgi:hypothetical protein